MPPLAVREQRVLRFTVREPREIVREQALQELCLPRSLDVDLAHVGDIEDATVAPNGEMLGNHAFVLHRHLPTGERHHAGTERDVAVVQRRASQSL